MMRRFIWIFLVIGACLLMIVPIWSLAIVPTQLIMPEDVDESVAYKGSTSMANPINMTQLLGPFELTIERTYKGIDTAKGGDAVVINETAVVAIENPMIPTTTETFILAVDRNSYEHLNENGDDWDHPRSGLFTFGLHPEKKDLEFWLHELNDTVIAKYEETTTYKGINVIKYSMEDVRQVTKNTELIETYAGMAYLYGDSQLNALYFKEDSYVYVDELSGIIVYIDRNTELTGDFTHIPTGMNINVTLSKMSYKFDEKTASNLIDDAQEADSQIMMFEITIPVILIIFGVVLILIGVVVRIRKKRKEKKELESIEA